MSGKKFAKKLFHRLPYLRLETFGQPVTAQMTQQKSIGLDQIREALEERRWAELGELSRQARLSAVSRDEFWRQIATLHDGDTDLVDILVNCPMGEFHHAFDALMPAVEHLPELSLAQAESLLQLGDRIEHRFLNGLRRQLERHIAVRPSLGTELGAYVLEHLQLAGPATNVWIMAFCLGAGSSAAVFTTSLIGRDAAEVELLVRLANILAMQQEIIQEVLLPVEGALLTVLLSKVNEIDVAWRAIANMSAFSCRAADALISAVNQWVLPAAQAMAESVGLSSSDKFGASDLSLGQCIDMLVSLAMKQRDFMLYVDQAISMALFQPCYVCVLPSIEKLGLIEIDLERDFQQTLSAICSEQKIFNAVLTSWLVQPGVRFAQIGTLLSQCFAQRAVVGLDIEIFNGVGIAQKVVAVRRLLSMARGGDVLCQFVQILAEAPELQPSGLQIAVQMLNEVHIEYPNSTCEFLKTRTQDGQRALPHQRVYRGVYANVLRWRRVLERLPDLQELRPLASELQTFRMLRIRENRDIMRIADEHSIFASIVHRQHIAQGQRFTTLSDQSRGEISTMAEASHSIELPTSERADPVGGLIRRIRRLEAAK